MYYAPSRVLEILSTFVYILYMAIISVKYRYIIYRYLYVHALMCKINRQLTVSNSMHIALAKQIRDVLPFYYTYFHVMFYVCKIQQINLADPKLPKMCD